MKPTRSVDLAVVGGGASGALLLANLAREGRTTVAWFERGRRFARGLAYDTDSGELLLNVPAENMGAFADRPEHFHQWLTAQGHGHGPEDFAPRRLFGEYLEHLAREAGKTLPIERVHAEVQALLPDADGVTVVLASGETWRARRAVLAVGNAPTVGVRFPPTDRLIRSPFPPGALDPIEKNERVLLIGTGLTAIDAFLLLLARGHRGPITAVSRHGLFPREHASAPVSPHLAASARNVRGLLRELRREIRAAPDWRSVIDATRPRTIELWKGLALAEQRRFLRHARSFWEVHRHRLAPQLAARVAGALREGRLELVAARVGPVEVREQGLKVTLLPRGGGKAREVEVGHAILCTGPGSWVNAPGPVARLVEQGHASADPLGLGLLTDPDGALVGSPRLFTLGPLRRGELWESTAIPEIRVQAASLAHRLSRGP